MSATYLIGWSLIHFIWQGALVAAGLGVFLALAGNRSPAIRYWFGVVALLLMAALPIVTASFAAAAASGTAIPDLTARAEPAQVTIPPATEPTAGDPAAESEVVGTGDPTGRKRTTATGPIVPVARTPNPGPASPRWW